MSRAESRIEEPVVRKLGTGKNWILDETYDIFVNDLMFTIPAGFVFNLASIPECLHWLIDEDELGLAAPLIHDALYQHGGVLQIGWVYPILSLTRRETDDLLYKLSILSGAKTWKARAAWLGVRLFGGGAWKDAITE